MLWALRELHAGRRVTAPLVAQQFGCGVRTIYRDFDFLRDEWGTKMEFDRGDLSFRLTEKSAPIPPIGLSEGELVALYFAEKVLDQYRGTPWEKDLTLAFQKIQALLPEQIKVLPDRLDTYLSLDLGPLPQGNPEIFREVAKGLVRGRRIRIRYQSFHSNTTAERTVDPYRFLNLKGDWYLVAWDHKRAMVRDFALHRIRRVTVMDESFTPHPGFNLIKYTADILSIEKTGRIANVAIRFAPNQARFIRERRWHRSSRIQERIDRGCVLRMRVKLTSELRRWVMQFGEEAEVLEPRGLRNQVAEALTRARALYAKPTRRPTS